MYAVVSPLRFPGPECAISSFREYILCEITSFPSKKDTMSEWERSAVVIVWIRVRVLLVSLVWFEFL